ncbi:MAG: hypothetical protein LBL47_00360 [Lactobacillus sp.]|jgi:hypothetical protein|nr:hypothetical protein [Lactobacillus sp.]
MTIDSVKEYHLKRRSFVILPEAGLLVAKLGTSFSHTDLLKACGISDKDCQRIIDNNPRGYFMNNNLVIYQGDNVEEGSDWLLSEANQHMVKTFWKDLKSVFPINKQTKIFFGVHRGKPGELWPTTNPVEQSFFE